MPDGFCGFDSKTSFWLSARAVCHSHLLLHIWSYFENFSVIPLASDDLASLLLFDQVFSLVDMTTSRSQFHCFTSNWVSFWRAL